MAAGAVVAGLAFVVESYLYLSPVLSIHRLTDTIVYGHDLAHTIDQEFREPKVTVAFWRVA